MAPLVDNVASVSPASTAGFVNVPVPSGGALTKALIAIVVTRGALTTHTPVDSWNLLASEGAAVKNDLSLSVWYRWSLASEVASYRFNFDVTQHYTAAMLLVSGLSQDVPFYNTGTISWTDDANTMTAPSVNISNNGLLLAVYGKRSQNDTTITPPTGMTELVESKSSSAQVMEIEVASQEYVNSGTTGDKVASLSAAASSGGILLALQPAITTTRLAPTEIVSMTNLTGSVDRIQEDPTVGDSLWLTYP